MAKKRLQVAALDAPTTVKPMASPVDIYTVPEKPFVDTQLAQFVNAITPAIEAEQQKLLQYRQDLERSVKQGFADQEAHQARLAITNLNKVAGEAYTNNEQYYLEAGRDVLAADRNKFNTDYITQLEDSGANPSVIKSIKQDLEIGNIKFFGEVYNPSKQDHDNKIALGTLREQITNDVNAPMLNEALKDKAVANSIAIFQKAYPNISLTDINGAVRETEVALSTMKDGKGVPRGSTALSKWIVDNNQHTTQEGAKAFATINNNQAAREVAISTAVKTSTEAIVKSIAVPTVNNIEAEFTGNEAGYSNNPKKLIAFAESRINEIVESTRESQGNAVANALEKDLRSRWAVSYNSSEILGKINAAGRTKALDQNMNGVLQAGIYTSEPNSEEAYNTTVGLINDIKQNSGLSELEVNQRLVDLVVQNAAEKGNDNAINKYLVDNNILQLNEFQDERASLVKALKTYAAKTSAKVTLDMKSSAATTAVKKLIASGGADATAVNNVQIVDPETGNTTKVSDEIVQGAYEKIAAARLAADIGDIEDAAEIALSNAVIPAERDAIVANQEQNVSDAISADVDRKLREFYLPAGQVPLGMAKQIYNTAVYSVLMGEAGAPISEEKLAAVASSLKMYQTLDDYQTGFGGKAFKNPDNAKRMKFLSILTKDGNMGLADAIERVQGPLYNVDQVKNITTKELDDYQIDIFGPFDLNPFSDVSNKGDLKKYINDNVSARMATLGESREEAFKAVAEEATNDFHIVAYPNGVETAVLKRNNDLQTLGQDVGCKMLALTEQATQLKGMNEFINSIVPEGGGLVMRNNPTNSNMVTMYITDETGKIASPVTSFSFGDLNNLPVEIMKERIARDAAEQLALTGSVTQEERDALVKASGEAAGAFGVSMAITEKDITTYAKAKAQIAEKRRLQAIEDAADDRPFLDFPEEAPTALEVMPTVLETLSQYVPPEVSANIINLLETSAPDIEARIVKQRKTMSNRKAINTAKQLLKTIDPALVDTFRLGVRGLEGRIVSERGITVNEQASNAHALIATVDTLKDKGILKSNTGTDFFLKPVTPDISGGMTMQKITPERATEILDNSLSFASVKKNVSPDDILNKVLLPIAWHESARTMDATIRQRGGGPAVGIMQFEPASFQAAVTRAEQWSKNNKGEIPSWITDISNELDKIAGDKSKIQTLIASLPAKSQLAIATYDLLEHPNADISKVISGEQTITEFWAKYWWAGDDSKKASHMKSFDRSQLTFNPSSIKL